MAPVSVPRGASFEDAKMRHVDVLAAMKKGTVVFNSAGASFPEVTQTRRFVDSSSGSKKRARAHSAHSSKQINALPTNEKCVGFLGPLPMTLPVHPP